MDGCAILPVRAIVIFFFRFSLPERSRRLLKQPFLHLTLSAQAPVFHGEKELQKNPFFYFIAGGGGVTLETN